MDPASLRRLALDLLSSDTPDPSARWRELLGGAWAVVDHFEHDGRRYFVALEASAAPGTPLSREERELLARRATGESVKRLAMDAGVSEATLSRRAQRAMKKLGIESQAELARRFLAMDEPRQSST